MWLRSPSFDGAWILSGLPCGLLFFLCLRYTHVPVAALVIGIILAVQTAHTIAPMMLAWLHRDFRTMMIGRWMKFIALPVAILGASTAIGVIAGGALHQLRFDPVRVSLSVGPTSLAEFTNPFMAMLALYALWNAYHFGKQGFGIMSIYRRKREGYSINQRRIDLWYTCGVIWAALAVAFIPRMILAVCHTTGWPLPPRHVFVDMRWGYYVAGLVLVSGMLAREWFAGRSLPRAIFILTDGLGLILVFNSGLWAFAIISLNHWLAAIGIAAHSYANHTKRTPWLFALSAVILGLALFCLLFVSITKVPSMGLTPAVLTFSVGAVGFRLGLGFVHFLFDRWLYKGTSPIWHATSGAMQILAPSKHLSMTKATIPS